MTDIVERLRIRNTPYGWPELADKAATEIEQLREQLQDAQAEIERLHTKLVDLGGHDL